MAQVAGIKIERDARGHARYARIDLRKHGKKVMPFLEEIGAINIPNKETLKALEDARAGKVNKCSSVIDFFEKMKK